MSSPEDWIRSRVLAERGKRRWTQAELARRLGCKTAKVSKLERGDIGISVQDVELLCKVFGRRFLEELTFELLRSTRVGTPESPAPRLNSTSVESYEAEFLMDLGQAIEQGTVDPDPTSVALTLADFCDPVLGSEVPPRFLFSEPPTPSQDLGEFREWVVSGRSRYRLSTRVEEGLVVLPALIKGDVQPLRRPGTKCWSPLAPWMQTRLRGPVMSQSGARLVLDPQTFAVTVIEEPTVVVRPLRVLLVADRVPCDFDEDWSEKRRYIVLRIAGVLSSSKAKSWLKARNSSWHAGGIAALGELPTPARILRKQDEVGLQIERLVLDILAGKHGHAAPGSKDPPPWQATLDEVVGPAMEAVLGSGARGGGR